ncbi:DUF3592 domain-containing protein [Streptomyces rishiriensis]|uniref:DUF3592 domain-containing protein n=1 Tax=Streptomyces rishiriensis TaxID=68264 RepID=UPI0033F09E6A
MSTASRNRRPCSRVAPHMERAWIFSLIPLTLGSIFLAIGVYGLRRAEALRRTGVSARGRIVRHHVSRSDDGARFHHPVAAWTTQEGAACEYPSRFGRVSIDGRFGVGASVVVRYDSANPRRFEIQGWDVTTADRAFVVAGSLLAGATSLALLIRLLVWLLTL